VLPSRGYHLPTFDRSQHDLQWNEVDFKLSLFGL